MSQPNAVASLTGLHRQPLLMTRSNVWTFRCRSGIGPGLFVTLELISLPATKSAFGRMRLTLWVH